MSLVDCLIKLAEIGEESKRRHRERIAKYLDEVAETDGEFAAARRDISKEYSGDHDAVHMARNTKQPPMDDSFLTFRMNAIKNSRKEVLDYDIEELHALTSALRRKIEARNTAEDHFERLASGTTRTLPIHGWPITFVIERRRILGI